MTAETPDRAAGPIATPCTNVCQIDRASRLCIGCLRTMDEIGAWTRMSPDDRRRVMAELPARRPLVRHG